MLDSAEHTPRNAGRRDETSASGRLSAMPSASAVTLTSTWLPR